MSPEDFRRNAHEFVDWMADYMEAVEGYPVRAQTERWSGSSRISNRM